jgi:hypothetical protein
VPVRQVAGLRKLARGILARPGDSGQSQLIGVRRERLLEPDDLNDGSIIDPPDSLEDRADGRLLPALLVGVPPDSFVIPSPDDRHGQSECLAGRRRMAIASDLSAQIPATAGASDGDQMPAARWSPTTSASISASEL